METVKISVMDDENHRCDDNKVPMGSVMMVMTACDEHHRHRGLVPTARASVSDYSTRQQPLVNFNEIKTCPALCLGTSLFIFKCWCVCVFLLEECCSAATTVTSQTQHKQNNVMYKRRMSNLITSHLYSL